MNVKALAKINLSLRVLGKRVDGFHDIETLICPIALADELTIERTPGEGITFSCESPGVPTGDTNLVVRAANAFFSHAQIAPTIAIHLDKKIPHGAGLGGGSSDAAATLRALNEMFGSPIATNTLANIAASLGSDVSFFLQDSAAVCTGRGENVEPFRLRERIPLLLLKPPFAVPTPWAYSRWNSSVELAGIPYAAQSFAWGDLQNDLERPVFEKFMFLALLKRWLLSQVEVAGALMSGSGSTMFAVLRQDADSDRLTARAREKFGAELWSCATVGLTA
ncbi:MAG: 4-(cytidine 5'-diphospho)-2-C-methyl-D-erythritol kinase [Verrucomicrobiota bacterium]|nr:4-(cytidine 5'-diphospho)-2-C-methyl-D-erythritol kinase [Verrucomicrobiota bacterium]